MLPVGRLVLFPHDAAAGPKDPLGLPRPAVFRKVQKQLVGVVRQHLGTVVQPRASLELDHRARTAARLDPGRLCETLARLLLRRRQVRCDGDQRSHVLRARKHVRRRRCQRDRMRRRPTAVLVKDVGAALRASAPFIASARSRPHSKRQSQQRRQRSSKRARLWGRSASRRGIVRGGEGARVRWNPCARAAPGRIAYTNREQSQ